jgi:hypothetical protein
MANAARLMIDAASSVRNELMEPSGRWSPLRLHRTARDLKMGNTRVVHVNDQVDGAVYIGRAHPRRKLRASTWHSPFPLGNGTRINVRVRAVALYRDSLTTIGTATLSQLPELRDKPLACWCRHDGEERTDANACHGDVLVELLERYSDDELRALGEDQAKS